MWKLYRLYRGGMASTGYLPHAGGSAQQAVLNLSAFEVLAGAEYRASKDPS